MDKRKKIKKFTNNKKDFKIISGESKIKFLIKKKSIYLKSPNYYKNKSHSLKTEKIFKNLKFPEKLYKYFLNRYNLFTKYDQGKLKRNKTRRRILVFSNPRKNSRIHIK